MNRPQFRSIRELVSYGKHLSVDAEQHTEGAAAGPPSYTPHKNHRGCSALNFTCSSLLSSDPRCVLLCSTISFFLAVALNTMNAPERLAREEGRERGGRFVLGEDNEQMTRRGRGRWQQTASRKLQVTGQ